MSENKRSFFSTIPGLVTGLAGLLTGIVGLVTVLIQLNIIGGDDANGSTAVNAGPTPNAQANAGADGKKLTTEDGRIAVDPKNLRLGPTEREKSLKVTNEASTATVTVLTPQFDGPDKAVFRTDAGCANARLEPGRSCTMKVLFTPSGPLKSYTATLVLKADGSARVTEVPVDASTLL